MIQFLRVATVDPVGTALICVSDISGIQTVNEQHTRIITKHEQYLALGSMDHFIQLFSSLFGAEWDGVPGDEGAPDA